MIIRKAKLEDVPQCAALSKIEEFTDPFGDQPGEEDLSDSLGKIFLVMEEDDEIIGFILGYPLTRKVVYLDLLTVSKKHRGKNIGQRLVEAFRFEMNKRGMDYYFLIAPKYADKTINFYRKLGLKEGIDYRLFAERL